MTGLRGANAPSPTPGARVPWGGGGVMGSCDRRSAFSQRQETRKRAQNPLLGPLVSKPCCGHPGFASVWPAFKQREKDAYLKTGLNACGEDAVRSETAPGESAFLCFLFFCFSPRFLHTGCFRRIKSLTCPVTSLHTAGEKKHLHYRLYNDLCGFRLPADQRFHSSTPF